MLTVFHSGEGHIISNDDYYIRELASGLDEVVFNVSIRDPIYQYINEEAVIKDRDQNVYLIKQIDAGDESAKVVAQINIDDWKSAMYNDYSNNSNTVYGTVAGILPSGWSIVDEAQKTIRRTIPTSDTTKDYNVTAWEILEDCCDVYSVRFRFNTKNKRIYIIDPASYTSRGAFATKDLNLRKLNYKGKSEGFATRLYAMGADGLTFASINQGKAYVDNQEYAQKVVSYFWKDDRYTVAENLLADARKKLAEMAQPTRSYDCDVLDLANTNPEMYSFEDFSLFEVVTLIDDAKEVRTDYQVVEHWIYPYYPVRNKVILSTSTPNIQKIVTSITNSLQSSTSSFQQILQSAIENSTAIITGNHGGYVVFHDSTGDGYPDEILIMNTPDISTATKVWRWNSAGLGYSHNGYNGPYGTAITIDGSIVADYITAGELNAAILKVGTITDKLARNYWNLDTGDFSLSASATIGGETVDQRATSVLNTWVTNTYSPDKAEIQSQIDGKAETWYQAADPSSAWLTTADKAKHVGDLWYDTTTQTTWFYDYINNVYQWKEQEVPLSVFDEIDGKAQIFITQPTPPYNIGDLWCEGSSGNILTCTTPKAESQSYSASDWVKYNKYTDQADINNSITAYNTSLDQNAVFNKLTNNGTSQGIFLENGQLYINGTYIQANTISANQLSVEALEQLDQLHNFLPFDIYENIDRGKILKGGGNPSVYFTTITVDGEQKTAIALDGTNLGDYYAALSFTTDIAGKPTFHYGYKIQLSANKTFSRDTSFLQIQYCHEGSTSLSTRTLTKFASGTSVAANTEYVISNNATLNYNSDPYTLEPLINVNFIDGEIIYLYDFEFYGENADYVKGSLKFTSDGLNSVVRQGSVISQINQSSEQVSIKASKIDLSGDLNLTGEFVANSATWTNCKAYMIDGEVAIVRTVGGEDSVLAELTPVYDSDSHLVGRLELHDLTSGETSSLTATESSLQQLVVRQLIVNGTNGGDSTFYRNVTFEGADNSVVQFKAEVLNRSGGTQFISDKRKKRSIKDLVIEKARSFIMGLKPKEFKFTKDISKSDRKHHGFIAQEVKEAMWEDWGLYCEDKEHDFIGLRYDELIADMVTVIQDQEKRIEALERRLDDLTNNKS